MGDHPLAAVLASVAGGRFPPPDGAVVCQPPDEDGTWAIVEFTAHVVVLAEPAVVDHDAIVAHGGDAYGGCFQPEMISWLAGDGRQVGSRDVVLVARARPGRSLAERTDAEDHPRVQRARAQRRDVRVHGDERGVVILGRGLVGRFELSVERAEQWRAAGAGRELIAAGLASAPAGGAVWAQVAAGNARSLRAFLANGFRPVGSELLLPPRR